MVKVAVFLDSPNKIQPSVLKCEGQIVSETEKKQRKTHRHTNIFKMSVHTETLLVYVSDLL